MSKMLEGGSANLSEGFWGGVSRRYCTALQEGKEYIQEPPPGRLGRNYVGGNQSGDVHK